MTPWVIDIEASGLYDTVDKIHCAVGMTLDGKDIRVFGCNDMEDFCKFLDTVDVWIGHNVIQYDIPVVEKVLGYKFKGKKVDTMLMSRLQDPHRQAPPQARGDKKAMMAPHGLGCWGYRVGRGKPEVEDDAWKGLPQDDLEILNYYET